MEGVMMRGHRHVAVAVRHPEGRIITCAEKLPFRFYAGRIRKIPIVRGMVLLWDALALGTRALVFSAEVATAEERGEREPQALPSGSAVRPNMLASLAVGIGLFFVAPTLIVAPLYAQGGNGWSANLGEGLVRLLLLMSYLWAIGRAPKIARVFAYHGAEHKTVHAQEQNKSLEPDAVQTCSTAHPRCGTTLLLVVVVLSIVVFGLLGPAPWWLRIISRVVLVPVVIGIAYEWLRFSALHLRRALVNALVWPGLLLQSLTTREPDDEQVAVAIAALKAVMSADKEAQRVCGAVAVNSA